jgi:hypothetical protein
MQNRTKYSSWSVRSERGWRLHFRNSKITDYRNFILKSIGAKLEPHHQKHTREFPDVPLSRGSIAALIIPRIYISNRNTQHIPLRRFTYAACFQRFFFQLVIYGILNLDIGVFLFATPCILVHSYKCFGRTCCLLLQVKIYEYFGREIKWQGCRVREWEADTAATRRHMPEGTESLQSPSWVSHIWHSTYLCS